MNCFHHLDREARTICQKMAIGYCQECLDNCMACTDPCGHCGFRQSKACIIWELCRKSERRYHLERMAKGLGVDEA